MSKTQNKSVTSRLSVARKQYKVLDESSRNRRNRQHIEQLERDNFHEDPHSNLVMHKKAPKFADLSVNNQGNQPIARRTNSRSRVFTLSALIEENAKTSPNYLTIVTRSLSCHTNKENVAGNPSYHHPVQSLPSIEIPKIKRSFCSVCGFKSNYTCIVCGLRYCSSHCLQIHVETRCLKWTG